MRELWQIDSYIVYINPNEGHEPVHVRVSKRMSDANTTKIWVLSNGGVALSNNNSRIPSNILRKISWFIQNNSGVVLSAWGEMFGKCWFVK